MSVVFVFLECYRLTLILFQILQGIYKILRKINRDELQLRA